MFKITYERGFIIFSILALVSPVILQKYFPGDFTTNYTADLFATIFGVLIAMVGTEYINSINKEIHKRKDRKEIVDTLLAELDTNSQFNDMNNIVNEELPKREEMDIRYLTTSGYDSIIFSGKYSLLRTEAQRYLTFHYEGIKRWNILAETVENTIESRNHIELSLVKKLQQIQSGITESIPDVKRALSNEIMPT